MARVVLLNPEGKVELSSHNLQRCIDFLHTYQLKCLGNGIWRGSNGLKGEIVVTPPGEPLFKATVYLNEDLFYGKHDIRSEVRGDIRQ